MATVCRAFVGDLVEPVVGRGEGQRAERAGMVKHRVDHREVMVREHAPAHEPLQGGAEHGLDRHSVGPRFACAQIDARALGLQHDEHAALGVAIVEFVLPIRK